MSSRHHKPWDRDQQFFEESGIRLYHFCGSGTTLLESRIRNLGTKMESAMKKIPCYDLANDRNIHVAMISPY